MVATWQNEPNAPKEECAGLGNHFQREKVELLKNPLDPVEYFLVIRFEHLDNLLVLYPIPQHEL
jgi:hypothetical protein